MSPRRSPRLESSIRKHFAPLLRRDGFAGSGRKFYKVVDGLAVIVSVQGSAYGGRFTVNFGVHPTVCVSMNREPCDPKKMRDYHCVFRSRLSSGGDDTWWEHDGSSVSMDDAVRRMSAAYEEFGRPLLEGIVSSDSAIRLISPKDLSKEGFDLMGFSLATSPTTTAWALAKMRQNVGRHDDAREFAALVLNELGSSSDTHICKDMRTLINECA